MSPPVKESQERNVSGSFKRGSPGYITEVNGEKKITGPLGVGTKDMEWWCIRPEQVILMAPEKG